VTIVEIENAVLRGGGHAQIARHIISEAGLDGQLSTLQREVLANSIEGLVCLLRIAMKTPDAVERAKTT
jgi:hypothetical protein